MMSSMTIPRQGELTPDYTHYDIASERLALRSFLDREGLWIPENFYSQIRQGDVIDLYANPPALSLLYCNTEFKRLCSYSSEQMKTLPFTKLFWRSDEIQQKLVHRTTEVALYSTVAESWQIESHELVESLHPQNRTFEIDLGYVAPCFKKDTNERVAFVSSLRVALIFEWPEFESAS